MRFLSHSLAACASTATSQPAAPSLQDLQGDWEGIMIWRDGEFYSEVIASLSLEPDAEGGVNAAFSTRTQLPYNRVNFPEAAYEAPRLRLADPQRTMITIEAEAGADVLDARISLPESDNDLIAQFRRNDPEIERRAAPRRDASGAALTQYVYSPPEAAGDGWAVATLADEGLSEEAIGNFMNAVLRQDLHEVDSVLIARRGRLVVEEYFYGYRREIAHQISSVTKSVTSLIVGAAIDQDLIPEGLDALVYRFFPDYAETRWVRERYPVKLRHVLSMTHGLEWDEESVPYSDERNTANRMAAADDFVAFTLNQPLTNAPGEVYAYSSGVSGFFDPLLTNATGRRLDELAEEILFRPLGVRNYRWKRLSDGVILSSGGMLMAPRDMAKLGQMMLDGGRWNGAQILPEDYVREAISQQTPEGQYAYGYLWHIMPKTGGGLLQAPVDIAAAAGQGGQLILLVPEHELVIVVTSGNFENARPHVIVGLLQHIIPGAVLVD